MYTRPQFEKKISGKLEEKGIEYFMPTRIEIREWHDRKKKLELPVFPSYIFVRVNEKAMLKIYEISGFVRFLSTANELDTVPDQEIDAMKELFKGNYQIAEENLEEGLPVMITEGPLMGLQGIVNGYYAPGSVTVNIEILNKYIRTVVSTDSLERIEEEKLLKAG